MSWAVAQVDWDGRPLKYVAGTLLDEPRPSSTLTECVAVGLGSGLVTGDAVFLVDNQATVTMRLAPCARRCGPDSVFAGVWRVVQGRPHAVTCVKIKAHRDASQALGSADLARLRAN